MQNEASSIGEEREQRNNFLLLPADVVQAILRYLDLVDALFSVMSVSHEFRDLSRAALLQSNLLCRDRGYAKYSKYVHQHREVFIDAICKYGKSLVKIPDGVCFKVFFFQKN